MDTPLKEERKPFLKLEENEEILIVNKFSEKRKIPISDLAKYHDANKLPMIGNFKAFL